MADKYLKLKTFWSEEDNEFVTIIDGQPGLSALGATERESLSEFADLLKGLCEDSAIDEVLASANGGQ